MRAGPKAAHSAASSALDKPVKQRIVEQAQRLFTLVGVRTSTHMIAHFAHTNVETLIKHFGHRERLVFDFLKSLMKQSEVAWAEIEQEFPADPRGAIEKMDSVR